MNSRERVRAALSFQPTDRIPRDLGAMRSTGISAFAYPALIEALAKEITTLWTAPLRHTMLTVESPRLEFPDP